MVHPYGARLVKEALAAPDWCRPAEYPVTALPWRSGGKTLKSSTPPDSPRRGFRPDRPSVNSLFVVALRDSPPPARLQMQRARGTSDRTRNWTPTASADSALPSMMTRGMPSFLSLVPRRAFLLADTSAIR